MGTFTATYWPACAVALGGLGVLGLSRRATRVEGVWLAIIMFGVGVLGMAGAIAYERYLTHVIHFAGPPDAIPGRTALALVTLVSVIAVFVPAGASATCFVRRMWTGSLAFLSAALFVSCVPAELSSLGNNDPVWHVTLITGVIGSVISALLAYAMSVRHRH